jgi:hypothetical protein
MEREQDPAALPLPSVVANQRPRRNPRRVAMLGVVALAALLVVAVMVWRNRPAAAPRERSIAVLPFSDMSPARDNEYFSDGLTEEIITGLSGVPELKVISRTSAMHYKGSDKPLRQIAEELMSPRHGGQRRQAATACESLRIITRGKPLGVNYDDTGATFRVGPDRGMFRRSGGVGDRTDRPGAQGTRDPEAYLSTGGRDPLEHAIAGARARRRVLPAGQR